MTNVPPEGPPEDPRDALIREQAERIAALEAVVADLREQLAAAERAGSRKSGNSSMPPSSDDLPGRNPPHPVLNDQLADDFHRWYPGLSRTVDPVALAA